MENNFPSVYILHLLDIKVNQKIAQKEPLKFELVKQVEEKG